MQSSSTARASLVSASGGNAWIARLAWSLGSLLAFLIFWDVAANLIDHRHLPRPLQVWQTLLEQIRTGDLLFHVGMTLARVLVSFVLAMIIGGAIGLALGRSKTADNLFDSWLIFFLNLPALVIIILCYVWFGLTETAAVLAVAINKIPNVAVTVREGARSLSRDLNEMAQIYRFGWWKTLRHVTLPQLAPFFAAAARSGLSLVWKIVLVVELLGRSNGVGFQLHTAFQLFDVSMILAYAVSFIFVVQIIEMGVLQPIEARVNRWRR
jgi:NitT/TauT family transport system permease protein